MSHFQRYLLTFQECIRYSPLLLLKLILFNCGISIQWFAIFCLRNNAGNCQNYKLFRSEKWQYTFHIIDRKRISKGTILNWSCPSLNSETVPLKEFFLKSSEFYVKFYYVIINNFFLSFLNIFFYKRIFFLQIFD